MTKDELIQSLQKDGYLKTPSIIDAFTAVDRKNFVPAEYSEDAYVNAPLPIGLEQTISQPLTVAFMLELLKPSPGEKILDVGAGSGWQTALLAHCVGETGTIIGIERIKELQDVAIKNIARYPELEKRIKIVLSDGSKGYEPEAPYDKIIAAAAGSEIPSEWKIQIKTGGVIVAPVKQSIVVIHKITPEHFDIKEYFGFNFVPLVKE